MVLRSFSVALIALFLVFGSAFALESKEVRIAEAVKRIVHIQHSGGESAAIELLKACYAKPLPGNGTNVVLQVEECVAQDIAYANLSAGMYRGPLKTLTPPPYITIESMKARVYAAVMGGGLSKEDADNFLRIVSSIALDSLVPAIKSLSK
jgi:O-acetyl-ADP-ribose deacetylase (regulator of RNase III)